MENVQTVAGSVIWDLCAERGGGGGQISGHRDIRLVWRITHAGSQSV